MRKSGISGVITTVIMVGLVLAAIAIVWGVIGTIIRSEAEKINLGVTTVNIEIKDVKVESNGNVSVTVSRNPGQGTLAGVSFIVSDGTKAEVVKKLDPLNELEEKIYILNSTDLVNVGFAKEVSIAPIFKTNSGKESIGAVIGKQTVSNKNIITSLSAVSWWKLDGNANDEFGRNNGQLFGGVNCNGAGKYGNSCNFTGANSYINIGNNANLNGVTGFSYSVWVKREVNSIDQWPNIIYHGDPHYYYGLRTNNYGGYVYVEYGTPPYDGVSGHYTGTASSVLPVNEWHYFTTTYDGSTLKIYKDSVLLDTRLSIALNPVFSGVRINSGTFNGTIDEVIIFNKSLTAQQVKALYNLDLSSA